jgi:hypothetical protein
MTVNTGRTKNRNNCIYLALLSNRGLFLALNVQNKQDSEKVKGPHSTINSVTFRKVSKLTDIV